MAFPQTIHSSQITVQYKTQRLIKIQGLEAYPEAYLKSVESGFSFKYAPYPHSKGISDFLRRILKEEDLGALGKGSTTSEVECI